MNIINEYGKMSWYVVYFLFTFIVTLMLAHVSNLGKRGEGKKNEKKSINSLIVKIDIDKFDSQNFVNSLGISRIVVVDEDGNIVYHIPENEPLEKFNDLKRIAGVIRALFKDIEPWIIIRSEPKVLLVMMIEYRNQRLYSVAEIYNDKLIDLLGVFDKSLKDVIISGIRE